MALKKIRLGELINIVDEKNSFGIEEFYGININKEFMPTAANIEGLNASKYKVVRNKRFVFSGMQTGRDGCIRISMYDREDPILVSPAYSTFEVNDLVLPSWFFMYFLSKEKDRLGAFYSDGSIRTNLDWDRFCDIEIDLPDLATQQKYVDIYNAMKANQKAYERGLEDLKLVCDGYIEKLRKEVEPREIGEYILCTDRKTNNLQLEIRGISNQQKFIESNARTMGVDKSKYLQVNPGEFAYSPIHVNDGSIAYNNSNNSYLLSPIYKTFIVEKRSKLDSRYLMMWFSRGEFTRMCKYYAFGSARDNFEWSQMCSFEIPIPRIEVQESIANIYKCYEQRKEINEQLKEKIRDICPILIKGSIDEARGN